MLTNRTLSPGEGPAIYDTVTGFLREVPLELYQPKYWDRVRESKDMETGELDRVYIRNIPHGPSLTLRVGGLLAERSLPKALHGQNIEDLTPPEVPQALAVVDEEIAEALPEFRFPPLGEWDPVRADYCRSIRCGDEAEVIRRLDKLAGVTLPYKGLPVRGENHGVRWAHGAVQPKFYGKYLETKGDPRALGVLRSEASVYRLSTFRKYAQMIHPRLVDVLTADVHEVIWSPFGDHLRGAALSKQEMSDLEFVRELVGFFGARRSASLIGYCTLMAIAGVKTRQDAVNSEVLEFRTKYRVLADIRAFRAAMAAKGYESDVDEGATISHLAGLRLVA